MGKTSTDPRAGLGPSVTLKDAVQDYAAGLASTYHMYAQVPLISAFVRRFYVEGHKTAGRQLEKMIVGTQMELAEAYVDAAAYYGVDSRVLHEVEHMISTCPIPSFLEHPLFLVLAERDYA
jgi:CMP-N-acetylneuraminic acid synthetase